jgi:hypothetical protein
MRGSVPGCYVRGLGAIDMAWWDRYLFGMGLSDKGSVTGLVVVAGYFAVFSFKKSHKPQSPE